MRDGKLNLATNLAPKYRAQWKLFFAVVFSCLLITPLGLAEWNYPKTSVLEFFSDWRIQITQDRFLDIRERDLRLQLVDRLSFQVDTKYSEQNFHQFLIDISNDIALTENMSSNRVLGSQAELFRNLSTSLQEVLEPSENILSFLRSFVEFSGVKNPKSVDSFADSRSYTNGYEMQSAEPITLDEAARLAMLEAPEVFAQENEPTLEELAEIPELLQFDHDLRSEFEPMILPPAEPQSLDSETPETPEDPAPDQSLSALSPQKPDEHLSLQNH
jgi:hypothetical protein